MDRYSVNELGDTGVVDMINLLNLNEQTILQNLQLRYNKECIYTYTGSILVAVNPYKMFNIYGLDIVKRYDQQILGSQPPHLFAIGSSAYNQMLKDTSNQVIVISGESGAGKTESTKLIMQYLAAVNKSTDNMITERILEANPLLESFGNAKTIRNDNSSRFGKYVEVYFKGGNIVGAKTSEYLLEKSRIVSQAADERNYHVFYEMLEGLTENEKSKYGLQSPEKYYYLNQGGGPQIESKNDLRDFVALRAAMDVLGFSSQEQGTFYKILAAVLHLGNVYFVKTQTQHHHDSVAVGSDFEVTWVCKLLELSQQWLTQSLTAKVTEARRERMLSPLNIDQAMDARDAIAKALYQSLFSWLVKRTNQIVNYRTENRSKAKTTSIAILDIFGFEDFRQNSFEQLCINYANETLQFYFNRHVFQLEQQEYAKEKIDWTNIDYYDNQPTIDLIAKKPNGIIHILDDESNFPKGTDYTFIEKCHFEHSSHPCYEKPRLSGLDFAIKHYAGPVMYNVKNFSEKNKDTLRGDVIQLLIQSKNEMISQMFRELRDNTVTKTISKTTGFYVTAKPKTPTVAASFHDSLVNLIENMARCTPWFVRCIKPNNEKAAMTFNGEVVLSQLRYTGMLETIKIRKAGYPTRYKFRTFVDRYSLLMHNYHRPRTLECDRQTCEVILQSLGYRWEISWQIGLTKVFLKESLGHFLEMQRSVITKAAVLQLQRAIRGYLSRRYFQEVTYASIVIQAGVRRWLARLKYQKMIRGFIKAQAQYRMLRQRRYYLKLRNDMRKQKEDQIRLKETKRKHRERNESRKREASRSPPYHGDYKSKRQERMAKSLEGSVSGSRSGSYRGVSVSHLEIPAELAYVFSKLDDWDCPHSERHIVNAVNVTPKEIDYELPNDINSYVFSKFVNVYFNEDQGFYPRKEPIKTPFLPKQSNYDNKESVAVFKLILRFMSDTNLTRKREETLGDYIVQKGLSNTALRDEIYCQLCNQTYMNPNNFATERGWILMANCLSCFSPSDILAKYLLKYVSDQAYDGYKAFCQHKLLQCLNVDPKCSRVYPPCMLEWKAARKKGLMALEAEFFDKEKMTAHVDSWCTAEEFASYLLQCRNIKEDTHGWTIALRDDGDYYEGAGYDYVLDLISEMEIPPSFPYSKSYYLVTSDRKEPMSAKREHFRDSPHNPDNPRFMELEVDELRKPIPVEPRPPLRPEAFFKYGSHQESNGTAGENWYNTRDELLSSSKLNQRKAPINGDLSHSALNVRYTGKRPAPILSDSGPYSVVNPKQRLPSSPISPRGQSMPAPVERVNSGRAPASRRPRSESPASQHGDRPPVSNHNPTRNGQRVLPLEPASNVVLKPTSPMFSASLAPSETSRPTSPITIVESPPISTDSALNDRYTKQITVDTSRIPMLSPDSKMNKRYTSPDPAVPNGNIPNGVIPHSKQNGDIDMPNGKRYVKNAPGPPSDKTRSSRYTGRERNMSRNSEQSPTRSEGAISTSNIDQWLDNVFDPVLDVDETDARALNSRLKGGKKRKKCQSTKARLSVNNQTNNNENINSVDDMNNWLENVFSSVIEYSDVAQREDPSAYHLEKRLKGGGDQFNQTQPPPVAGPTALFPPASTGIPLGNFTPVSPLLSAHPTFVGPTAGSIPIVPGTYPIMADQSNVIVQQMVHQQALQAQMQNQYRQQADLQARLQTQQLETRLLQESLQAEWYKKQIDQLKGSDGAAVSRNNSTAGATRFQPAAQTYKTTIPVEAPSSPTSEHNITAHGEIDDSRPGGVKTLTRGYETKSKLPPVTPKLFEPPPRNQAILAVRERDVSPDGRYQQNRQSLVKFADTVEHIPRSQHRKESPRSPSPSPATQTRQPTSPPPPPPAKSPSPPATNKKETTSPPPPPPPPPALGTTTSSTLALTEVETQMVPSGSRQGVSEVVRIGKITWPPPTEEEERPEVEVGKLMITENQRKDAELLTGNFNAHQKIQEKIAASKAANQKEEQKKKDLKKWERQSPRKEEYEIDMKARQKTLEKQLSAIMTKQEETQTPRETISEGTGMDHDMQTQTAQDTIEEELYDDLDEAIKYMEADDGNEPEPQVEQHSVETQTVDDELEPHRISKHTQWTNFNKYTEPVTVHRHPSRNTREVQTQTEKEKPGAVLIPPLPVVTRSTQQAPPPPPPPPPPVDDTVHLNGRPPDVPPIDLPVSEDETDTPVDLKALEHVQTKLFKPNTGPYYTYVRTPWKLEVRKELFTPTEKLENPALVHLIFAQVVQDVYNDSCIRIGKEDRIKMKSMLDGFGINPRTVLTLNHKAQVKKQIIDTAREWPYYFARIFAVNGGRVYPNMRYFGVTDSGLRLLGRDKDLYDDQLKVIEEIRFEDIVDVSVPRPDTLQLHLAGNRYVMLYTPRAEEISSLTEAFCIENEKDVMYVKAVKDYLTRDSTLLNFRAGDIITLTNKDMMLDRGWLYGSLQGRAGMFPAEYIIPIARHEVMRSTSSRVSDIARAKSRGRAMSEERTSHSSVIDSIEERDERGSQYSSNDFNKGLEKYPMLEFAMLYFRDSPYKYEMKRGPDGSIHGTFRKVNTMKARAQGDKSAGKDDWKQQVDMVKWTKSPIQASLLKFDPEMNKLALQNFIGAMRFMGDYPMANGQTQTDIVYEMLKACHANKDLRDELFCHLAKQTCHNNSMKSNSSAMGWRLLSILTSFFDCSDVLRLYLIKYLEQTAYDSNNDFHLVAQLCLQNLRQTAKYGGRRNVPSNIELMALSKGRSLKRQLCYLPGGNPVVLSVKSSTVVIDCIDQVCNELDITNELEKEEYTIFYVVEKVHKYCPLQRTEYLMDVTTELENQKSKFYLLFQRTSWVFPMHLGSNSLYVDTMYHQVLPDYNDGFFSVVETTMPRYLRDEVAMLTAYQFRSQEKTKIPQQKDVKALVPKFAEMSGDMNMSKWTNMVTEKLKVIGHKKPHECRAEFLDLLTRWRFFGSTFFTIKGAEGPGMKCGEALLAINRLGVHILETKSHKAKVFYAYKDLLTSRRHKDDRGKTYLDLKHGDLRVHNVTTIETDQATAINTLISQYFNILKVYRQESESTPTYQPPEETIGGGYHDNRPSSSTVL